jgi:hypothetical protein
MNDDARNYERENLTLSVTVLRLTDAVVTVVLCS